MSRKTRPRPSNDKQKQLVEQRPTGTCRKRRAEATPVVRVTIILNGTPTAMAIQSYGCARRIGAPAAQCTANHAIEILIIYESCAGQTLACPKANDSKPVSRLRSLCVKIVSGAVRLANVLGSFGDAIKRLADWLWS